MNTMAQISHLDLNEHLRDLLESKPYGIQAEVIREALEYHDIESFFSDLLQHGCISGMIGSLIYYTDTHAFYDKHYAEIEDLRSSYEESTGEPLSIQGDLKNFLAWYAFEETAFLLACRIRLTV